MAPCFNEFKIGENMNALAIFSKESQGYNNLKAIRDAVNKECTKYQLEIKTIYFDIGQNWLYTTLLCRDLNCPKDSVLATFQALDPKMQKIAVYGSDEERQELINDLIKKYR